jgi:hypothetical protein
MIRWDIIGDIHGQAGKLRRLLEALGYELVSGIYRHPTRKALFLGDYIDRGTDSEGVLHIVRDMVEGAGAVALMGNHELNALHYHRRGADGRPLRPHSNEKTRQHSATLLQFRNRAEDWGDWLKWMAGLPLCFETDEFRAVHACWSERHVGSIEGGNLADLEFLRLTSDPETVEGGAIEVLLKGPEINLPEGVRFIDKDGHKRNTLRIRWWGLREAGASYQSLVMPPGAEAPEGEVEANALEGMPDYSSHNKPVFFGHYWLPPEFPKAALHDNIACLDYSAGKDGPLVACRWRGSVPSSTFHTDSG